MRTTNLSRSRFGTAAKAAALALSAALLASACGNDGGSGGGGDFAGVDPGATKEEYQAALADIDDITIITQVAGGPGSSANARYEAFYEAVEDWSGGKITFEVNYSNSIVPPEEIDAAIADGRLDMAYVLPVYAPDVYAANQLLADVSVVGNSHPYTGTMMAIALGNDLFFQFDEFEQEIAGRDIYPLAGNFADGLSAFFCSDSLVDLDDFRGTEATVSNRVMPAQLGTLGVSAVSVSFAEYYESLQRGVVDCVPTGAIPADLAGLVDQAPNVTFVPERTFAASASVLGIRQQLWDDLPLPARQLLHDRLDAFFIGGLEAGLSAWDAVLEVSEDSGGVVTTMDDDAAAAFAAGTDDVLADVRDTNVLDGDALVDAAEDSVTRWTTVLSDLGAEDPEPADLRDWYAAGDYDYVEFIAAVMSEIYADRRPS